MKHYPPPSPRLPRARRTIPAFHPVPIGQRADGWTHERQAQFIGYLAETGSVLAAARKVSMGRESAYRLRARHGAAGFAAAWDAALGKPHPPVDLRSQKATQLLASWRSEEGLLQVVMQDGKFRAIIRKADNDALLQQITRLDRMGITGQ